MKKITITIMSALFLITLIGAVGVSFSDKLIVSFNTENTQETYPLSNCIIVDEKMTEAQINTALENDFSYTKTNLGFNIFNNTGAIIDDYSGEITFSKILDIDYFIDGVGDLRICWKAEYYRTTSSKTLTNDSITNLEDYTKKKGGIEK